LDTRVVGRSDGLARPPAVKQAAVIALCTRQESAQAVAQKLGVCRPTLYNWKNQLLGPEKPASMKRRHETPPSPEREELERQLDSLRRDVHRLQLEHDLLKKANEIIKKDTGIDRQVLTNREKAMLVDALRQTYPLSELREALGLARSSYFYHRARLQVAEKYTEVRCVMADIFERNHRCYRYRRMQASLSRQYVRLSEKLVQRLMKQECLVVAKPKRRRYGSYLGEISPAPDYLANRDFTATAPNKKWSTDVTEFNVNGQKH
jgi:putative transposase